MNPSCLIKIPPKPQSSTVSKRVQVTDTSGWTHIIKGSKAQNKQLYLQLMAHLIPQAVDPTLNMDKVLNLLKRYTREWEESDCREKILTIVEEKVLSSGNVNITNCVCLGLGSLTGLNNCNASWYELATLISILEILGKFSSFHKTSCTETQQ